MIHSVSPLQGEDGENGLDGINGEQVGELQLLLYELKADLTPH